MKRTRAFQSLADVYRKGSLIWLPLLQFSAAVSVLSPPESQCTLFFPFLTSPISPPTGEWRLSCRTNPLVIPVSHDLSVAFYHTKAILVMFASRLVAISGVGLRSFQFFDPITISGCQSNEIYNPTGQRWFWKIFCLNSTGSLIAMVLSLFSWKLTWNGQFCIRTTLNMDQENSTKNEDLNWEQSKINIRWS